MSLSTPSSQSTSSSPPSCSSPPALESLSEADARSYEMLAMEVWAIAKTMDTLMPGFWNRFIHNRRLTLQEYKQKRYQATSTAPSPDLENLV